ncbi:MAG TPA: hypothetical protein VFP46_02210 [Candidatus Paceibacterota bacterium]|nr:hypothetical protein [Candidatus Paceibacterota bacterium]
MEHDAWFFIGVFIFIFLIWIATGGPLHPLAFAGPRLAQPGALGGGTYLSLPRAPLTVGNSDVALPGSSTGGGSLGGGAGLPGGSALTNPSTYRNTVVMSHGVSGAAGDPSSEYILLYVPSGSGVPVDISGWQLVSEATGNASYIPRGTEVPMSGTINAVQDIVLTPGTRAYLISGRSPIGGSFRENKCIGYYSNFQSFYPSLPQNCPTGQNELGSYYADSLRDVACTDYTNRLSRCQAVLTPPTTVSSACQNFLVKYFNYNGCADTHRSDADFLGDTWHIYLGRTTPLWRSSHELVKLLDREGAVVDAFTY